jgi:hypothetical protein
MRMPLKLNRNEGCILTGKKHILIPVPYKKYILPILFGLFVSIGLKAQFQLSGYIDAGETNVSEGLFVKAVGFGAYQFEKNKFESGFQFDLKSPGTNIFTGTSLKAAREFSIKEFPFEIQGLFIYNCFSELVHEYDWGVLARIQQKHFSFILGTNFRTYKVTRKAIDTYDINSNKKIHENWNVIYSLGCSVKPYDHFWNIGLTITNIDHFVINQETNPVFNINAKYNVSPPLTLFAEAWYKSSGALNLSVNYFGFFFRTGVIWRID